MASDEIHNWYTKYIYGFQGLRKALLNRPVDVQADWTGLTKSLPDSFPEVAVWNTSIIPTALPGSSPGPECWQKWHQKQEMSCDTCKPTDSAQCAVHQMP